MFIAAQNNHKAVVELLLAADASKDLADEGSVTPLYVAALNGHTDVVRLVLDSWTRLGNNKVDLIYPAPTLFPGTKWPYFTTLFTLEDTCTQRTSGSE